MGPFVMRICDACGTENRVPARHLADTGRCGNCRAPLPPTAQPIEADPELFADAIASLKVPVLVDFWADWCGPCHMAAPHVKQVATEMAGKTVVFKVDTERFPHLAEQFQVRALPTFIVFKDGKPVARHAGLVDARQMKSWLEQARTGTVASA